MLSGWVIAARAVQVAGLVALGLVLPPLFSDGGLDIGGLVLGMALVIAMASGMGYEWASKDLARAERDRRGVQVGRRPEQGTPTAPASPHPPATGS